MKTLYYDIIFRHCEYSYNEGFIILKLEEGRIKDIEGVLTCDYIKSEISDEEVKICYYEFDSECWNLVEKFQIYIKQEYFELPMNLQITDGNHVVEIMTKCKVTNPNIKEKYNKILIDLKKNYNVF